MASHAGEPTDISTSRSIAKERRSETVEIHRMQALVDNPITTQTKKNQSVNTNVNPLSGALFAERRTAALVSVHVAMNIRRRWNSGFLRQ